MKTAAMKTKRGSSLKDAPKGQPTKQKKGGAKSRLLKTTPGFSMYASDELTKSTKGDVHKVGFSQETLTVSKGPRLMNGDQIDAVTHEDNIISQVQLVDSKSKERLLKNQIHITTIQPRANKIRPTSPDVTEIPISSEVRTPFNRRLISSTPDPERLFLAHDDNGDMPVPTENVNVDKPSIVSAPQLVPERDTQTGAKSTKLSTIDVISSMLMTQRQNQMLWQQQLEQFKLPTAVKVSEGPHSAFHQWKGLGSGDNLEDDIKDSGLMSEDIKSENFIKENQNVARWIVSDSGQSGLGNSCTKTSDSNGSRGEFSNNQHIDPPPYVSYGTTSAPVSDSVKVNNKDIVSIEKLSSHSKDSTVLDSNTSSDSQPEVRKKTVTSKSKDETGMGRNKTAVSSRVNSKASAIGVKVLPLSARNRQENSKDQAKSSLQRKIAPNKPQTDKVKTVIETNEPVKKKKVLHVNLPRDERGSDVPPNVPSDDDSDDESHRIDIYTTSQSQHLTTGTKTNASDSVSMCGEEVNSLLSKESEKSIDNRKAESITISEMEGKERQSKQSDSVQLNKADVDYNLVDKHINITDFKNEGNFVSLDSHAEQNAYENKSPIDNNFGEEAIVTSLLKDYTKDEKEGYAELAEDTSIENHQVNESDEVNLNQNYHDDDYDDEMGRQGNKRYRLHFLEKMADKTLMDIVCKLTLKAAAIRDTELRDLIDNMIYNTDATLAREDGRFQSSQAFFMEENGKLKKRLHTLNKQLEAKERQERQADLYPGISNNDVMHMERKNLYLRQEKERLDNQVTNLLEEKAKWLVKQQDLVKTISLKDREILKLEGKFQEEKKTLHKAVDEAAKNSQGVHFKLSVADREIANLEQRVKTKDREITELKTALKDAKDDLQCCVDSRTEKNKEIQRLQELVNTLKLGVDEVMKAYEASTHSQPVTADERQGMESLRRLVTESLSVASSLSHIPEQLESSGNQRKRPTPVNNEREFAFSTSTRQDLPPHHSHNHHHHHHHNHHHPSEQQKQTTPWKQPSQPQKHKHSQQEIPRQKQLQQREMKRDQKIARDRAERPPHRSTHRADTDDGIDWYAADSSLLRDKDKAMRSRHDSGSALTVQALEDHNRRHSPIDRTLWHSLDTGHVMPPFTGEEPYHSDSEIQVANSKTRKRMDQGRLVDVDEARDTQQQLPSYQLNRRRRKSDDFTERKRIWNDQYSAPIDSRLGGNGRFDSFEKFDDRRAAEQRRSGKEYERAEREHESRLRGEARNFENENEPKDTDMDELDSITLHNNDNESDLERSRYSVSDYFKKYPQTSTLKPSSFQRQQQQQQQEHCHENRYPMNSKDYWFDSGTADDQDHDETSRQTQHPGHSSEQTQSLHNERYPSLESILVSDQFLPSSHDRRENIDQGEGSLVHHTSGSRQKQTSNDCIKRSIRLGKIVQNQGVESQRYRDDQTISNPLSSSYPTLRSEVISSSNQPQTTTSSSRDQYPSLLSTSLPASNHRSRSERNCKDNENDISRGSDKQPSSKRDSSYQQDYPSSEYNEVRQGENKQNRSYRFMENSLEDGRHVSSMSRSDRPAVTFRDPSVDSCSVPNQPSQSFQSDFLNGRTSFPPHSSPVNTSDISVSRRATRGSETSQQDFFRGTELSASYSSISDTDLANQDYSNNNPNVPSEYGEESFNTGIASLDSKIAELEAKINRTKAVFS